MRRDGSHNGRCQRRFCPFAPSYPMACCGQKALLILCTLKLWTTTRNLQSRNLSHRNKTATANGVTGGGVRISNLSLRLTASLCLHLTLRRLDDLMEGGECCQIHNSGILRVVFQNILITARLSVRGATSPCW